MKRKRLLLLLALLITAVTGAWAQTIYLDFENGAKPQGWTNSGKNDCYVGTSGYDSSAPAYDGNYSFYFSSLGKYDNDYFVSPAFNFQGAGSLSFAYATPSWASDQNTLTVAYSMSSTGPWTKTSFAAKTSEGWSYAYVDLSSLNGTYYIAFISYDNYGHCTAIDNINLVVNPTYTVNLNDGAENPTTWTGKVGTGDFGKLPLQDVSEGQTVTLKYSGNREVKSITATVQAPAEGKTLAEATVGMIMGTDGKAYAAADKDNLPKGVTAAGMVAYKNGSNGLVIALTDKVSMVDWGTAGGTSGAAGQIPAITGLTWKLPSDDDWKNMFFANGGNFSSYNGLNTALVSAGGTALKEGYYWTSAEDVDNNAEAWVVSLYAGQVTPTTVEKDQAYYTVRAVLEF